MALAARFAEFHKAIQLDQSRTERIKSAHTTLRTTLEGNTKVGPTLLSSFLQGSYASGTAVRPIEGEYDVDVVLALKMQSFGTTRDGSTTYWTPAQLVGWLKGQLEQYDRYKGILEVMPRCVRIDYAGDFHIDVVPTLAQSETDEPIWIGAKGGKTWEKTAPRKLLKWISAQNGRTNGSYSKVLRATKRWRDLRDRAGVHVPSVALSVLLGKELPDAGTGGSSGGVACADALWLQAGFRALDRGCASNAGVPQLSNPSNEEENLARDWNIDDYRRFRAAVVESKVLAEQAVAAPTERAASEVWQRLLGSAFKLVQ